MLEGYTQATVAMLIFPGGLFALMAGLLFKGIDRVVVARAQRRVGPPIMQPFYDIIKLSTKEILIPESGNERAFRLAPAIGLAGSLVCAALIPVSGVWNGISGAGDIFVLLYLLGLPAIAFMLGGSASSSPFGALGFSREMIIMFAYEIPLLATLLALSLRAGWQFSLNGIITYQLAHGPFILDPVMIPAFLAYLAFIAGTMGSGLFDIPEAEEEVIEGPVLEYSGPLLALFNLMTALKLFVVLSLGVTLFLPTVIPGGIVTNILLHLVKCLVLMLVSVSLFRASTGRLRIDQAFTFFLKYPSSLAYLSLGLAYILR
ncbi:respiratory chain complex I subunit 1 family protein [Pseudodesulfovibrio piezophilus]|uniref:Carbon monoxide-induced hydrogenase, subunit CooK n=1 Tax=Pseudodesulfovibrio piezophilus (strain DSM 21447 / JCM 15486 / C1TLV30) TaxID=1322246 RepID=M1WNA9_PSEP2|nr:complex I subunit 1 family protein [Pseudodesulfovibrio piezophilus]CCH50260.1 Carbon monoxide-induced hydrogenase, subunit CooK [Pseudodesulfovibrio piezophilus C1TLV30]